MAAGWREFGSDAASAFVVTEDASRIGQPPEETQIYTVWHGRSQKAAFLPPQVVVCGLPEGGGGSEAARETANFGILPPCLPNSEIPSFHLRKFGVFKIYFPKFGNSENSLFDRRLV